MRQWLRTHTYSYALLYLVVYLVAFFLLEHSVQPRYIVHCFLDDWIPFCELFIIPYLLWFPLLAGSLGFFLFKSKEDFQNLCMLMFTGMSICLLCYAILPNGLHLREPLERDNLFCRIVAYLYQIDTPTNVCPSIHVSSTVAIHCVVKHSSLFKENRLVRMGSGVLAISIILATVCLKQHSVIDVILGCLLSYGLCYVTYHWHWRELLAQTKLRILL